MMKKTLLTLALMSAMGAQAAEFADDKFMALLADAKNNVAADVKLFESVCEPDIHSPQTLDCISKEAIEIRNREMMSDLDVALIDNKMVLKAFQRIEAKAIDFRKNNKKMGSYDFRADVAPPKLMYDPMKSQSYFTKKTGESIVNLVSYAHQIKGKKRYYNLNYFPQKLNKSSIIDWDKEFKSSN